MLNKPGEFIERFAGKATDRMLDVVDVDAVLEQVDVDALLARVDLNALIDRVDVQRLLNRVDPNLLLARVDVNALADRLDLDALLAEVDIQALVGRSGVPEIIADSTSQFAVSGLDLARKQIVGVDAVLGRMVDRIFRRDPSGDRLPEKFAIERQLADGDSAASKGSLTGHFAGPVARGLAALADIAIILTLFSLAFAGIDLLLGLVTGWSLGDEGAPLATVALFVWAFFYWFGSVAIAGQSVGKALLGVRVVCSDGSTIGAARSFWCTALLPLGFITAGLTFLPIVLRGDHRAVHDLIAGTAVVIDWGDRAAAMPAPLAAYLSRHDAIID